MWIYKTQPSFVFVAAFVLMGAVSYLGYLAGGRIKDANPQESRAYLAENLSATILGLLALILAFTFSMATGRFEKRRQLVIDESNAIGTAYLRSKLLRPPHNALVGRHIKDYLDLRIEFYNSLDDHSKAMSIEANIIRQQKVIWEAVIRTISQERGAIENGLVFAVNEMIDLENERTIALNKTLPPMVYWSILFISAVGLASMNYVRAEKKEVGQWQPGILVLVIAFMFFLILDMERPTSGAIRVTQEAMIAVREFMKQ